MDSVELKAKRILVTGGNGYLGGFLVKALLKEGAKVFILSDNCESSDIEYQVDITNFEEVTKTVQEIQPDIIYHLAANLNRSRDFSAYEDVINVNVTGTYHLLKSIKNKDCHFIFTSTSEIYGNNASPFHENQIPQPVSPYSLSKINAEYLIETFCKNYNKNYTNLRIFNFFGEGMSERFFIPQMLASLQKGKDFLMTKGEQKRDFLYIKDVIQALLLTAKNKKAYGETFNVCSGQGVQLKVLAQEVQKHTTSSAKIVLGALPYRENEVWEMIGDGSKIKDRLGFTPNYTIEEGIKILIDYDKSCQK